MDEILCDEITYDCYNNITDIHVFFNVFNQDFFLPQKIEADDSVSSGNTVVEVIGTDTTYMFNSKKVCLFI